MIPGAAEAKTLVGLAGTVTTVAAVELGLPEYDRERIHHFRLTRAAAEDVFRTLATESAEQRAHNPGLEPGRVDVIVGGAIVLVGVLRVFGFDEMLVSRGRHPRRSGAGPGRGPITLKPGLDPSKPVRGTGSARNPPLRPPVCSRMRAMQLDEFVAALARPDR